MNIHTIGLFLSFPVTDEMVGPLIDGVSINSLLKEKRLFIIDLATMEGLPTQKELGRQLKVQGG